MKIAINNCYGGFSLSLEAVELYGRYKFDKQVYHFTNDFNTERYTPTNSSDKSLVVFSFTVPNPNDFDEKELWANHNITSNTEYEGRNDETLIRVIEELGSKRASGVCAELKIVEVPDDVEWYIHEYDGHETVNEKHRSWG